MTTTEEINELIKASFGKRYAGNYRGWLIDAELGGGSNWGFKKQEKLDCIVRRGIIFKKFVGRIKEDGSAIAVFPGAPEAVERYKDLYKQKYGKKVEIFVEDCFLPDEEYEKFGNLKTQKPEEQTIKTPPLETNFIDPWKIKIPKYEGKND